MRAWNKSFKLPTIITHCSNNYGPWQFPEKLIPLIIHNALINKYLPIYGDGSNIRDWIYVDDHVSALIEILENGKIGETYNIGANQEISNLKLVEIICKILDDIVPANNSYFELIKFVKDRPGHDFRYSINTDKISKELNFFPRYKLDEGMLKTVKWYVDNKEWLLNKK